MEELAPQLVARADRLICPLSLELDPTVGIEKGARQLEEIHQRTRNELEAIIKCREILEELARRAGAKDASEQQTKDTQAKLARRMKDLVCSESRVTALEEKLATAGSQAEVSEGMKNV